MTPQTIAHKLDLLSDMMLDVAHDMQTLDDDETQEHAKKLIFAAEVASNWSEYVNYLKQ